MIQINSSKNSIIAPKFEKEILSDLDLLKNIDEVREEIKFTKESLDGFEGFISELIIQLESIFLELYFETNAIKLNKLILDKNNNSAKDINIVALFECITWLNNNSKLKTKEYDWTKDFKKFF